MTSPRPRRHADWYFDILSPFAYLQLKAHMRRLLEMADIRPRPIVLGAILSHWGQKGPAEIEPKRLHTYRLAQHRAGELGVPFRFPPAHPFNPIAPSRVIVARGSDWATIETVFDAIWLEGLDLSDKAGLESLARALSSPDLAEHIGAEAVKQELRANGEAALAAGVFGVPTFVMDGQTFWGEDATGLFAAFVEDPDLFRAPEMARLEAIPVGISRK